MVGKYLTNLHLNKTICAYIIVLKRLKIQYLKCSAQRGTSPSFYMCIIEYVIVSMFEFTMNEATTSSHYDMEGESKIKVVIAMIRMLAIIEFIVGKWF